MPIRLLHTGDFHGKLSEDRLRVLAQLREQVDYYFDCGDSVAVGNLGVPIREEKVWEQLSRLGCYASVPGNRESHPLRSVYTRKLHGASHHLLCANLFDREGNPVHTPVIFSKEIGVIGVMVPMVTERMASKAVSDYLWSDPIEACRQWVEKLRPKVETLIAITHIGYGQDQKLAEACPELDIILGGHSHTVLHKPQRHGSVWIAHSGSHARFAGVYAYEPQSKTMTGSLRPLDPRFEITSAP